MKRCITAVLGLFALLMMVMPGVASADVVWRPVGVRPVVVQEAVVPTVVPAPSRRLSTIGRGHAPIRTIVIIITGDAIN